MRQSLQRKFLYGSVLVSAIPIGVMLYEQATAQKPVIVKSEKERIKDLEARAEALEDPKEIAALPPEEFQKMKQQLRQKHPGIKEEPVPQKIKRTTLIIPYSSSEGFTQSKEELTSLVEDVFGFIDHPEIKAPKFDMKVPRSRKDITPSKDTLTIYAVEKFGTKYECEASIGQHLRGRYLGINFHGGDAGEEVEVARKNGIITITGFGGNILLAKPSDEITRVTVPPAEVLHRAVRNASLENLRRKLQYATDKQGKLPKEFADRAYQQAILNEEGIVHAVVYSWLRKNRHKYQITPEELEERIKKDASKERYCEIPTYFDRIAAMGARKTIDLYISNTD